MRSLVLLAVLSSVAVAQKPLTKEGAFEIVKQSIADNTNDPAKLEFVAWGGSDLKFCTIWTGPVDDDREVKDMFPDYFKPTKQTGFAIIVKYREANALGAKVLKERGFMVSLAGKIVRTLPVDCIKVTDGKSPPKAPASDDELNDPLLDDFLEKFPKRKM